MKILSIDASTKSTGFAIYDGTNLTNYGCFTASSTNVIRRIKKIVNCLQEVIENEHISVIILEEVFPEKELSNFKTHKALMWLQAAINFMINDNFPDIQVIYLLPSEWRSRCGIPTGVNMKRQSLKPLDIAFVKKTYGIEENDDIADAIAIGHAYLHSNTPPAIREISFK